MSRAGERSLQFGLNVANQLSSPIMDALKERRQRDQALQDQDTQLKNALLLHAATNPEIANSLITPNANGALPAQSLTPEQQASIDNGTPQPNQPILNYGGISLNPQTLDTLTKQHEAEQMANKLAIAEASRSLYGTLNTDQGIMNINKRNGEITPALVSGNSLKQPEKQFAPTQVNRFTDAQGNLMEAPKTGGAAKPVLDSEGKPVNVGIANHTINTDQGIVSLPNKTNPNTPPSAPTPIQSQGKPLMPFSSTKTDDKTWENLIKNSNPITASSRSALGVVASSDSRANRALVTLQKPTLTNQEAANIMTDIAGIYKGGSPTESDEANNNYSTLYGKIQNTLQSITGSPRDAVPEAIKQKLLETVQDMKRTNQAVINQNFEIQEATHPDLIQKRGEEWQNFRSKINGGLASGIENKTSSLAGNDTALTIREHYQKGDLTKAQALKMLQDLKNKK